jgi:hypothetical protein
LQKKEAVGSYKINQLGFGTVDAIYMSESKRKEEKTMKTSMARKATYVGAGAGLVLFALFGLMPGSLLGGVAGINIAGWLFGLPLEPRILSRVVVLACMLIGVLVSGIVITTATSTVGWLVGKLIDSAAPLQEGAGREAKVVSR